MVLEISPAKSTRLRNLSSFCAGMVVLVHVPYDPSRGSELYCIIIEILRSIGACAVPLFLILWFVC